MKSETIHTSTDGNACGTPAEAENSQSIAPVKRFFTCRCKTCNGLTYVGWYDPLEDSESANKDLKRLRKQGRAPQIEVFQDKDPMPEFCCCRRPGRAKA